MGQPEVETQIDAMREQLDQINSYVNEVSQKLCQFQDSFVQLNNVLTQVSAFSSQLQENMETCKQLQDQLVSVDTGTKNNAAVIQRELTHLQEQDDAGAKIRAISSLLKLSLRLGIAFFPPEQLKSLAENSSSRKLDILRKLWMEWLGELIVYLDGLISLIQPLAEINDNNLLAEPYLMKLHELGVKAGQLVKSIGQK